MKMTHALATVAACMIGLPSAASADLIVRMNTTNLGSKAYWYSATNVVDASTGQSALGGSGQILCFDPASPAIPGRGEQQTFTAGANIFYYAGAMNRGLDLVNWLVDKSYAATFDPATRFRGSDGFQNVLWELARDFTGSNLASLSFASGAVRDSNANYDSANAILTMLKTSIIPVGYRSQDYFITFLKNGGNYQDMVYISRVMAAVPEPSTIALSLAGLPILALVARRRVARGRRTAKA